MLEASTPLADEGPSTVVQLDGLADKAKVGLSIKFGDDRVPSEAEADETMAELAVLCKKFGPTGANVTGSAFNQVSSCDRAKLEAHSPDARRLMGAFRRTAWLASLAFDAGPKEFEFADGTTFEDASVQKVSTSVSASLGALFPNNLYAAVSVSGDRAYEATDRQAVCTAGAPSACPLQWLAPPHARTGS